jgi:uncharacterized protein (DUF58 family)
VAVAAPPAPGAAVPSTTAPHPAATRTFPRPTGRVVGLLALVAVVTVAARLPGGAVLALVAAVVGAASADGAVVARRTVAFRAELPTAVVRGEPVPYRVAVDADGRVTRLRQPTSPEVALLPAEAAGPALDGALTARCRGSFTLPGAIARLAGPLGLATVDVTDGASHGLDALPDLPGARRLAVRRRGAAGAEGAAMRRLGIGTEFESVRDYDDDDDLRFVNWLATSRCGRPMTNQYRVDENRDVWCLLDAGRLACAPLGSAVRLDVALDALCALGAVADETGDRLGAVAFAGGVLRRVAPTRRGTADVVAALYDLQPVEVDSDFDLAFHEVASRKRAIVVVFTDLVDPAASRTVVEALPVLSRRHEVVVATATDTELAAMAVATPSGYADVARAAAALRLLDEHREVLRRVAALGCEVVAARPERLGLACVAAYRRLKSRARV